jgi:flagella basal body P-ring formation protein FlgA
LPLHRTRALKLRAAGILTALALAAFGALGTAHAASSATLDDAAASALALVRAQPLPDGARLDVEALPFDPRLDVAPCTTPLVAELVGKRIAGARATVRVRCVDAANPWSIAVALRIQWFERVLVAKHALIRGDIVDDDSTTLEERDVTQLGYGHIDDLARYAGSRLTRPVVAGAAIPPTALAAPILVERGETVTLLARSETIDVRASGVALEDGSAGARVHVRNASSGKAVSGVVTAVGEVMVER